MTLFISGTSPYIHVALIFMLESANKVELCILNSTAYPLMGGDDDDDEDDGESCGVEFTLKIRIKKD